MLTRFLTLLSKWDSAEKSQSCDSFDVLGRSMPTFSLRLENDVRWLWNSAVESAMRTVHTTYAISMSLKLLIASPPVESFNFVDGVVACQILILTAFLSSSSTLMCALASKNQLATEIFLVLTFLLFSEYWARIFPRVEDDRIVGKISAREKSLRRFSNFRLHKMEEQAIASSQININGWMMNAQM